MSPEQWVYTIPLRLRSLFRRRHVDQELDDELRDHIVQKTAAYVAQGKSPQEARRAALIELGGAEQAKEECRDARRVRWLQDFAQDLRFGLRLLRKSPGFTAVAVLTLALGIGASTAVFSLVDAVLLKPLPFPHAERIVFPWRLPPRGFVLGYDKIPWSRVDFLFLSQESKTFEALGAFQSDSFNLTGSGEPVRVDGLRASAGLFPSLGVSPVLGRTFTDEEDRPGNEHEVILSDALWRSRFGADPGILGRAIDLNGAPYTVIGVMPRGFAFPRGNEMPASFTFPPQVQLWVPLALNRGPLLPYESYGLAVIGRLKPGITIAQAQADMDSMAKPLQDLHPTDRNSFASQVTLLARQTAGDTRQPLLLILAAVGVVLLIACSNVASLLLMRSLNRKRELTVRAALGAAGPRLIRQLLTESIVLAGLGGMAGILLAKAAIFAVKILGPSSIPRLEETGLDIRVLIFALGVTILTGVLFGLAPALGATRGNLVESLKSGGHRSGVSRGTQKIRNSLLVSQIALALVLVVVTGLLTRTFYRLLSVDPGFHAAHVLTFGLSLPASKYPDQSHIVPVYQEVLRHLRMLPGAESAGLTDNIPMNGATDGTRIRFSDRPGSTGPDSPRADYIVVSPGYFSAVGTPILRGRAFVDSDTANSMPVAIVSATFVKKYWPDGQDPVGKQIAPKDPAYPLATIVGIAADVKHVSLRDAPSPEMYVPYTQKIWTPLLTMNVVLRTAQDPASLAANARAAIHSVDPDLPVADVKTLDNIVGDSVVQPRFAVLLLGAFGGLAVLLAAVGMYGVISYSVAQRTQEIGIRIALGAQRGNVLQIVFGQGSRLAAVGIVIGLVVAIGVTRLMSSFLYGVGATDPLTFAGVAILLALVALAACYIPARRAMKVDPTIALRYE
ncbi:MAG TPA: ABC transporter permease [Candidatus Acidoferrales bacterium]|nr:ABC transporter permease [Candidatus Acidoferrales bacterium]